MPRGKSWLMATVALKFFLLSLHTSSLPRWGGLKVGRDTDKHTKTLLFIIHEGSRRFQTQIFLSLPWLTFYLWQRLMKSKKIPDAYFPCSAVIYSSQEIVLGAGAVRDCLRTGWGKGNIISGLFTVLRVPLLFTIYRWSQFFSLSPQNSVRWCCLLYSSSPWWLCSSRCPPRLGVLAVSGTLAWDRSLHRSQPGSFRPSPAQKTSRCWCFITSYPVVSNTNCWLLKLRQPEGQTAPTFQETKTLNSFSHTHRCR